MRYRALGIWSFASVACTGPKFPASQNMLRQVSMRLWCGSQLTPRVTLSRFTTRALSTSICVDVTKAIGKTPLVQLNRVIGPDCKAKRVLAKLEMQNPGGSVKDRIALAMIEMAEARGEIHPSRTTIVEATSGNTGIGLAMVCAAKGYKCVIIMPQIPPMLERYIICRKFGAGGSARCIGRFLMHAPAYLSVPPHAHRRPCALDGGRCWRANGSKYVHAPDQPARKEPGLLVSQTV